MKRSLGNYRQPHPGGINSPVLIVNTFPETRGINNSQSDPSSVLLQLNIMLFDTYRIFLVGPGCCVGDSSGVELGVKVCGVLVQCC